WIQQPEGTVLVSTLAELAELPLAGRTVILAPQAGGLMVDNGQSAGLFDASEFRPEYPHLYDVSGEWRDEDGNERRGRVWKQFDETTRGMRLIRTIDTKPNADEEAEDEPPTRRYWYWYVKPLSADDDASKTALDPVRWDDHTYQVMAYAEEISGKLGLPSE